MAVSCERERGSIPRCRHGPSRQGPIRRRKRPRGRGERGKVKASAGGSSIWLADGPPWLEHGPSTPPFRVDLEGRSMGCEAVRRRAGDSSASEATREGAGQVQGGQAGGSEGAQIKSGSWNDAYGWDAYEQAQRVEPVVPHKLPTLMTIVVPFGPSRVESPSTPHQTTLSISSDTRHNSYSPSRMSTTPTNNSIVRPAHPKLSHSLYTKAAARETTLAPSAQLPSSSSAQSKTDLAVVRSFPSVSPEPPTDRCVPLFTCLLLHHLPLPPFLAQMLASILRAEPLHSIACDHHSEDPERFESNTTTSTTQETTASSHTMSERPKAPGSPNAKSQDVTVARGFETDGVRPLIILPIRLGPFACFANGANAQPSIASFPSSQTLNQHPSTEVDKLPTFRVGVSEDRNKKCRRTMEDAHSFIYDFGGVPGQGYFAVFE